MGLSVGIIGLPNVGKSTLFNAIMGRQAALTAPYPFATVKPNVGVVDVPDERLEKLHAALSKNPRSGVTAETPIVRTSITFVDIAGLVKGAAEGQGLGNQFLSHIRDVDVIVHVLREFEDPDVPRHQDSKNPQHDAEIVETELGLKDLEVEEKNPQYGDYLSKKPVIYAVNVGEDKLVDPPKESSFASWPTSTPAKSDPTGFGRSSDILSRGSKISGSSEKPTIYAINLGEKKLQQLQSLIGGGGDARIGKRQASDVADDRRQTTDETNFATSTDKPIFYFSAKIEEQIAQLPKDEQQEFLAAYNLRESGLDRIIKQCYELLGLISFFTVGKIEVRAWPLPAGSTAVRASGVIHSDFERLFIRAEVINWAKIIQAGSWTDAKEKGWVKTEGRDYVMRDGEVANFLIGK